jgi:1-acyl-sn-glycerol-3-phosphate acyltransferase
MDGEVMRRKLIRIFIWKYLVKSIVRYIVGISYRDNSAVKKTKQFILVGNHNSHLDTATILSALPNNALENTHPVAAADYFGRTPLTTKISEYFLNAVLIKRCKEGSGENPIEQMDKMLKAGKSLIIFPEGSRGNPEEMQKFKKGIGILLEKNPEVPFIPVYLDGMGKALPKGDGLLVPFTGSITFGKPSYKAEHMCIDKIVQFVEQSVLDLSPFNMRSI